MALTLSDTETGQTFGEVFRGWRKKAGLTQEQSARKLDVTLKTVQNWESGKHLPDVGVFFRVLDLFDVRWDSVSRMNRNGETLIA